MASIWLPSSLFIDITNQAAAQVFLRMRQHHGSPRPRVLEHVVRAQMETFSRRSRIRVFADRDAVTTSSPPGLTRWSILIAVSEDLSVRLTEPRFRMDCRVEPGNYQKKVEYSAHRITT
jgi:hypothetical protein